MHNGIASLYVAIAAVSTVMVEIDSVSIGSI